MFSRDISLLLHTDDTLGDIERLDALLNNSHELTGLGPSDGDERAAHDGYQFIDKEVTVEDKHCHVQEWLDGLNTDIIETTDQSTCETKPNQTSCFAPLLQLLFAKGILDEVRPHLPAPLQNKVDEICHQSLAMKEVVHDTCNEKTAPLEKQNSMKELKGNSGNKIKPTLNCKTNREMITTEKELVTELNNAETKQRQQNSNFNDNKSIHLGSSANIILDESRMTDKHKVFEEDSLLQSCIKSPLIPKEHQVMSEGERQGEKNATKLNLVKHSSKPNAAEANSHNFVHIPELVPSSSRNIRHATPCFHQGPKRLLNSVMFCLGCAPRPDGIILTSRNFLSSLQNDKHTCPFHKRLVDKHFQKHHCTTEPLLQLDKIDTVTDHDSTQPLHQGSSSCNNGNKGTRGEATSPLQNITNKSVLNVFDYHTPIKHEPRPTQLINIKVSIICTY